MKSDLGQLTHGSGLLKKFGCWRGKQWFAGLEQMPYAEKRNKLSIFMFSRRKLRGVFVSFCEKIGVINRLLKAAEKRLARVSGWELKSYHIKWEITLIVVCTTEPLNQTALGGLWFFLSYSFMTKTWWLCGRLPSTWDGVKFKCKFSDSVQKLLVVVKSPKNVGVCLVPFDLKSSVSLNTLFFSVTVILSWLCKYLSLQGPTYRLQFICLWCLHLLECPLALQEQWEGAMLYVRIRWPLTAFPGAGSCRGSWKWALLWMWGRYAWPHEYS